MRLVIVQTQSQINPVHGGLGQREWEVQCLPYKSRQAEGRIIRNNISGRSADNEVNTLAYSMEGRKVESSPKERTNSGCKGNLTIKHNTQILARGIQSILGKYNTAEGCIPCKGGPKRKLSGLPK